MAKEKETRVDLSVYFKVKIIFQLVLPMQCVFVCFDNLLTANSTIDEPVAISYESFC